MAGVQEGTLPLSLAATDEQVAEEGRLFYVGVTRARTYLLLTWSRGRRGGGFRQPSRFLDGLSMSAPAPAPRPGPRPRLGTAQTAVCRVCERPVNSGAERKLGRHLECTPDYDEQLLTRLKEWRARQAAERSLPGFVIFTDATLMAIAEAQPPGPAELQRIPGVGPAKTEQYGAEVLALVAQAAKPGR